MDESPIEIKWIEQLPLEIFIEVIIHLDWQDIVRIGIVNKELNSKYHNDVVIKIVVDKFCIKYGQIKLIEPNVDHKITCMLLDRGVSVKGDINIGNTPFIYQYCYYALERGNIELQVACLIRLCMMNETSEYKKIFINQIITMNNKIHHYFSNKDLLFILENRINGLTDKIGLTSTIYRYHIDSNGGLEYEERLTKHHYDKVIPQIQTPQLLDWILSQDLNFKDFNKLYHHIVSLKDEIAIAKKFIDHQNVSLNTKVKMYIQCIFPKYYAEYRDTFKTCNSYYLTYLNNFVNDYLTYLTEIIGDHYTMDDVYFLITVNTYTEIKRQPSQNQAVNLFNALLFDKVLDNESRILLTKINYQNTKLLRILTELFKYHRELHSYYNTKRRKFVRDLLKSVQIECPLKFKIPELIHCVYELLFDNTIHFDTNQRYDQTIYKAYEDIQWEIAPQRYIMNRAFGKIL